MTTPFDPDKACRQPAAPSHPGLPCALRPGHDSPHEPMRRPETYTSIITIDPAHWNRHCSSCSRDLRVGEWCLTLPEVQTPYGRLTLCRGCASDISRAVLLLPTGPAPDPRDY